MANTATIRIEGLPELRRLLRKVSKEAGKALDRELRAAGRKVRDEAADIVARRSRNSRGRIKRGLRVRLNRRGVQVVSTAPHAAIVHFGGRHPLFGDRGHWFANPKIPYLFDASEELEPEIRRDVDRAVDTAVGRLRA